MKSKLEMEKEKDYKEFPEPPDSAWDKATKGSVFGTPSAYPCGKPRKQHAASRTMREKQMENHKSDCEECFRGS